MLNLKNPRFCKGKLLWTFQCNISFTDGVKVQLYVHSTLCPPGTTGNFANSRVQFSQSCSPSETFQCLVRALDSDSGDLDSEGLWKFRLVILRSLALSIQLQDSTNHQEFLKILTLLFLCLFLLCSVRKMTQSCKSGQVAWRWADHCL